jgi:predicted ATP-grasp superfamily ATP-dependent carboligase
LTSIFVYEYLTGGGIDPELAGAGSLADLSALIVEGRVMRDALVADLHALGGIEVTFASSPFENVAPGHAHCMARSGETMTDFVARVARDHDYTCVIAPECDGLLLGLHDAVSAAGSARWLGCTPEAIALATSKRATAARLAAHGIAATPAIEPAEPGQPGEPADMASVDAAQAAHGRWVVKPDDGAGGLDTFVFDRFSNARAEYLARLADGRNPVLQSWVEGEPLSLSLVCGEHGVELLSINRQRIALNERGAEAHTPQIVEFDGVQVDRIDRSGERGRQLAALARRVAEAVPGLRGFVGIDVVWNPERGPVVVEINSRLTVAYASLSDALNRNVAADLLAAHGVPVKRGAARQPSHAQPCGVQP